MILFLNGYVGEITKHSKYYKKYGFPLNFNISKYNNIYKIKSTIQSQMSLTHETHCVAVVSMQHTSIISGNKHINTAFKIS